MELIGSLPGEKAAPARGQCRLNGSAPFETNAFGKKLHFTLSNGVALTKNEPGDCLMAVYGMNGHLVGGFQFGRGAFLLSFWSSATHAQQEANLFK